MAKLYSNPWKDNVGIKSRVKYAVRNEFYKWLLIKYCKGCKTVIDIACGPGQFMKVANSLGYKAIGVDADERYKAKNVIIEILGKLDSYKRLGR